MRLTSSFQDSIKHIFEKVKNREHFSFSKFADGEYKVLRNEFIQNCDNWIFDPIVNFNEQKYLMDSFLYNHPDYYVGISCPCCQPHPHVQWMRNTVGTENVTWANLFVNGNYSFFTEHFFDEFSRWDGEVILVANEQGFGNKLPFYVSLYYPIKIGSWFSPELEIVIEDMKEVARSGNNNLFLFSSGPLGNILAHLLHLENPNNTYLDIGSTINPWVVGNNRSYLKKNNNKICRW